MKEAILTEILKLDMALWCWVKQCHLILEKGLMQMFFMNQSHAFNDLHILMQSWTGFRTSKSNSKISTCHIDFCPTAKKNPWITAYNELFNVLVMNINMVYYVLWIPALISLIHVYNKLQQIHIDNIKMVHFKYEWKHDDSRLCSDSIPTHGIEQMRNLPPMEFSNKAHLISFEYYKIIKFLSTYA